MQTKPRLKNLLAVLAVSLLCLSPQLAAAAQLTSRSMAESNSAGGAPSAHTFKFTTATSATIGSIGFLYCTSATGACTTPAGLLTTSATLTQQNGATGFSMVNGTNGAPYIMQSPGVLIAPGTALTYTLSNITNPTPNNSEYYVRITTYTGSDGATGATDTGVVAVSTATPLSFTGTTPESLIFCVGTSITTDCSTVAGSSVDFGVFSPLSTSTGNSVMQSSTNAGNGYNITVNGTTLASGANSIPFMTSMAPSATGTSQFGMNLRSNTTPINFGADPSGPGSGNYAPGYNTVNQYQLQTGDTVATAPGPSDTNTFTSSYVVNIKPSQAAGVYTTTLTYVCTANF